MDSSKLKEIAQKMLGQDNRCTADPIFIVQQKTREYGLDLNWWDDYVWFDAEEWVEITDEDVIKACDEYYAEYNEDPEDFVRTGYKDFWEFVQPFFSEKAAQEYIDANRHNLTEPRIYVDSAHRNKEWQAVREFLIRLQEKKDV